MKVFWDTNLWVYLFDASSPGKRERIRSRLNAEHHRIITSTQVLQEFYVAVTRKLVVPMAEDQASEVLSAIAQFCTVVVDVPMISSAINLCRTDSFSFWDALIVTAAREGGAEILLSEDLQHGRSVGSLTIVNPFSS